MRVWLSSEAGWCVPPPPCAPHSLCSPPPLPSQGGTGLVPGSGEAARGVWSLLQGRASRSQGLLLAGASSEQRHLHPTLGVPSVAPGIPLALCRLLRASRPDSGQISAHWPWGVPACPPSTKHPRLRAQALRARLKVYVGGQRAMWGLVCPCHPRVSWSCGCSHLMAHAGPRQGQHQAGGVGAPPRAGTVGTWPPRPQSVAGAPEPSRGGVCKCVPLCPGASGPTAPSLLLATPSMGVRCAHGPGAPLSL